MEYNLKNREITLHRIPSELDELVLRFTSIIERYVKYTIISGYISILLGRARATEDVDLFIEFINFEKFKEMYNNLKEEGFWCLNAEDPREIFSFLEEGLAVRFSIEGKPIPNFEVKFPKREIDKGTFEDFLKVHIGGKIIIISSLERQIAFKRYYLKSDKDIEDAIHIEELFKEKIDYEKINKLRRVIESIK